ncbi:hypothetical protein AVEN_62989-1 [Araneus ventricosus]|uniref:Uncharacterized protein n=1 Tax=Araneus ventricosus TaxID=182803 RepID=A0A4Y2CQV5_ARAVE|nr:hypothetical protein AVEN_62989-1 [Araneus ventricosus]
MRSRRYKNFMTSAHPTPRPKSWIRHWRYTIILSREMMKTIPELAHFFPNFEMHKNEDGCPSTAVLTGTRSGLYIRIFGGISSQTGDLEAWTSLSGHRCFVHLKIKISWQTFQ